MSSHTMSVRELRTRLLDRIDVLAERVKSTPKNAPNRGFLYVKNELNTAKRRLKLLDAKISQKPGGTE